MPRQMVFKKTKMKNITPHSPPKKKTYASSKATNSEIWGGNCKGFSNFCNYCNEHHGSSKLSANPLNEKFKHLCKYATSTNIIFVQVYLWKG